MIKTNLKETFSVYDVTQKIGKIYQGTLLVYGGWKTLIAGGVPPLTLLNCKGVDLIDYKLYGNSVQDGTPTPETPIEIESVGDKTKNLFDNEWKSGIYSTVDGKHSSSNNRICSSNFIKVKPKTNYTISFTTPVVIRSVMRIIFYDSNDTFISSVSNVGTFTTPENCEKLHFYLATDYTVDTAPIGQIELGIAPTEYEPYGYKIPVKVSNETEKTITNIYLDEPLRKNGDYEDCIDFKNREVDRPIKEIILNGTETWQSVNTGASQYYAMQIGELNDYISDVCLCTHYEQKTISGSTTHKGINIINSTTANMCRLAIRPNLSVYTNVVTFKEYLAEQYANGSPVKIYGILATSYDKETIELPNIPTFKGTTILSVDTTIQPSNLEVVYKGKRR